MKKRRGETWIRKSRTTLAYEREREKKTASSQKSGDLNKNRIVRHAGKKIQTTPPKKGGSGPEKKKRWEKKKKKVGSAEKLRHDETRAGK